MKYANWVELTNEKIMHLAWARNKVDYATGQHEKKNNESQEAMRLVQMGV